MSDSKKKNSSFRKLFPSLFFSNKSKEKTNNDSTLKCVNDISISNQYQSPQLIKSDKYIQGEDSERIYENLTTANARNDIDTLRRDIPSNYSSNSTLVSENVKTRSISKHNTKRLEKEHTTYTARPQVPPKPVNEMLQPSTSVNYNNLQYPDVYYHSLDKLCDKISPLDEIEIYKASQAQTNPASVGAEIKKVSTKFLISPKKEAEVRTIQPTRARSLSFDYTEGINAPKNNKEQGKVRVQKTYNYSAPTSPIPISYKIPNMPKTISPYEQVKKNMIEAEEKRNTLGRSTTIRNKSTPSPSSNYYDRSVSTPIPQNETLKPDENYKEKTRQKVEAFYWQKLKEMKQKEDEYFFRQSSMRTPVKHNISSNNSNCSTPTSLEPRSYSLPRGKNMSNFVNQPIYSSVPLTRVAPERRTDTFIKSRTSVNPEIVYRYPEKLAAGAKSSVTSQESKIYQRVTLPQNTKNDNNIYDKSKTEVKYGAVNLLSDNKQITKNKILQNTCKVNELKDPPLPPIRTTSVNPGKNIRVVNNRKIIKVSGGDQSIYSESESGSEAGEIKRILQFHAQKGKTFYSILLIRYST